MRHAAPGVKRIPPSPAERLWMFDLSGASGRVPQGPTCILQARHPIEPARFNRRVQSRVAVSAGTEKRTATAPVHLGENDWVSGAANRVRSSSLCQGQGSSSFREGHMRIMESPS